MTSERDRALVYRLVRWVLLALVGAGIIGMHVLSEQDSGGGHGIVVDLSTSAAAMGLSASTSHPAMDMTSASAPPVHAAPAASSVALLIAANDGMSGSMAMCLLFLGAGAAAIALMLLAGWVPRGTADSTARVGRWWGISRRWPPPSPLPPYSLCVLRV